MRYKVFTFCTLVLMILYSNAFSQDCYIVLKVKGTITLENTGEILQKDSKVCAGDNVSFGSPDAAAILYNSSNGRYTLKPNRSSESELSGIIRSLVSNALSTSHANVDTRGEEYDLKKLFKNNFYVIGSNEIFPDADDYPLTDSSYFYITFMYSEMTITSRLKNSKNSFFLDKRSVYTVDRKEIEQNEIDNVTLNYFNKNGRSVKAFKLRFLDTESIRSELTPYITELRSSGKTDEEIINEVLYYIYDIYGPFSSDNLRKWLSDNFNLGI